MKRYFVLALGWLVTSSFFLSCSPRSVDIGVVASSTGRYAPLLDTGRKGAILAAEDWNRTSSLDIRLHVANDESDPALTRDKIEELYNQGIRLFILSITSGAYGEAQDFVNNHDILVLTPTVSSDNYSRQEDNMLRLVSTASSFGQALGRYAALKAKDQVVLIYDENNLSYSQNMGGAFLKEIPATKTITQFSFNGGGNPSFTQLAQEVAKVNPDTIMIIASPFDTALICQRLETQDKLTLISPWGASGDIMENGGQAVEGVLFYLEQSHESDPKYLEFKERYFNRFGTEMTYQSIRHFDALNLIARGISETKSTDPQVLKEFIIDTQEIRGLVETYYMDPFGDTTMELTLHQIREGEMVIIENN